MNRNINKHLIANDVEAVVTSFNQGTMILEAVHSLCCQTTPPARIIIVDDGSTDRNSINILNHIETDSGLSVPITIIRQPNNGVSAATHILRREAWEQCGGYDESMRSGFEDWDFFLSMLETAPDTSIGIIEKPLINYRTAPASSNVTSMTKRLDLMRFIIEKHIKVYQNHITDAILGVEATSMARLSGWECEISHTITSGQNLSKESSDFVKSPSYGDGGMAAAVRIVSSLNI